MCKVGSVDVEHERAVVELGVVVGGVGYKQGVVVAERIDPQIGVAGGFAVFVVVDGGLLGVDLWLIVELIVFLGIVNGLGVLFGEASQQLHICILNLSLILLPRNFVKYI